MIDSLARVHRVGTRLTFCALIALSAGCDTATVEELCDDEILIGPNSDLVLTVVTPSAPARRVEPEYDEEACLLIYTIRH